MQGLIEHRDIFLDYPFGMVMPNREWTVASDSEYRFGFNGKELDNETSGNGNQYDYGYRIYNPRIGRFLSVDPLSNAYPWYAPYQFAGNKPIIAIDLDGLEEYIIVDKVNELGEQTITLKSVINSDGIIINMEFVKDGIHYKDHNILLIRIDKTGKQELQSFDNISELKTAQQLVIEQFISKRNRGEFETGEGHSYPNATVLTQQIRILPTPIEPEKPPLVNIQFEGNDNSFMDPTLALAEIDKLANYLNTNPDVSIHITGHTGESGRSEPEGNSPEILKNPVPSNEFPTTADLQIGRARAVQKALIEKGIAPSRITIGTGTYRNSDTNRRVGIRAKTKT